MRRLAIAILLLASRARADGPDLMQRMAELERQVSELRAQVAAAHA